MKRNNNESARATASDDSDKASAVDTTATTATTYSSSSPNNAIAMTPLPPSPSIGLEIHRRTTVSKSNNSNYSHHSISHRKQKQKPPHHHHHQQQAHQKQARSTVRRKNSSHTNDNEKEEEQQQQEDENDPDDTKKNQKQRQQQNLFPFTSRILFPNFSTSSSTTTPVEISGMSSMPSTATLSAPTTSTTTKTAPSHYYYHYYHHYCNTLHTTLRNAFTKLKSIKHKLQLKYSNMSPMQKMMVVMAMIAWKFIQIWVITSCMFWLHRNSGGGSSSKSVVSGGRGDVGVRKGADGVGGKGAGGGTSEQHHHEGYFLPKDAHAMHRKQELQTKLMGHGTTASGNEHLMQRQQKQQQQKQQQEQRQQGRQQQIMQSSSSQRILYIVSIACQPSSHNENSNTATPNNNNTNTNTKNNNKDTKNTNTNKEDGKDDIKNNNESDTQKIISSSSSLDSTLEQLNSNIQTMISSPFYYHVDVYWIMSCQWEDIILDNLSTQIPPEDNETTGNNFSGDSGGSSNENNDNDILQELQEGEVVLNNEELNHELNSELNGNRKRWEAYLRDQLPNGVGLEIWEDAVPFGYTSFDSSNINNDDVVLSEFNDNAPLGSAAKKGEAGEEVRGEAREEEGVGGGGGLERNGGRVALSSPGRVLMDGVDDTDVMVYGTMHVRQHHHRHEQQLHEHHIEQQKYRRQLLLEQTSPLSGKRRRLEQDQISQIDEQRSIESQHHHQQRQQQNLHLNEENSAATHSQKGQDAANKIHPASHTALLQKGNLRSVSTPPKLQSPVTTAGATSTITTTTTTATPTTTKRPSSTTTTLLATKTTAESAADTRTIAPSISKFMKQHRYVVRDKLHDYDIFLSFTASVTHSDNDNAENSANKGGGAGEDMLLERITGDHISSYFEISSMLDDWRMNNIHEQNLHPNNDIKQPFLERPLIPGLLSVDIVSANNMDGDVRSDTTLRIDTLACCKHLFPEIQRFSDTYHVSLELSVMDDLGKLEKGKEGDLKGWKIREIRARADGTDDIVNNREGNGNDDDRTKTRWIAIHSNIPDARKSTTMSSGSSPFFENGWILTKEQLLRIHHGICHGRFLPPFNNEYGQDHKKTLDGQNGLGIASPLFTPIAEGGCGINRAVSLDPDQFSRQLIHSGRSVGANFGISAAGATHAKDTKQSSNSKEKLILPIATGAKEMLYRFHEAKRAMQIKYSNK